MKRINILVVIATLLLFSSCKKWLDVKLINTSEEADLFSSEQGFSEALAGVYFKMSGSAFYGQTLSFGMLETMGQTYEYSQVMNGYKIYRDYNYKDQTMEAVSSALWYTFYSNLAAINNIIEWIDKTKAVMTPERRNQIKGEALALRAFHHFDIYRLYAPDIKKDKNVKLLPYQNKFGVETPPAYRTEDFLNMVIADYKAAIELLKDDPIKDAVPYKLVSKDQADQFVARINLYAAKAMLARVYLDMGGEWKKEARKLAEEVIASKKFALMDYRTAINVPEADRDQLFSDEHVFSLRNKAIKESAKGIFKQIVTTDGNLQMPASFKAALYEADNDDFRLNWFTQSYIVKYNIGNEKRFVPKIPLIKLAEMYLIAAECWMEDDPAHAAELLKTFRQSRTLRTIQSQPVTEEIILKEIRKESVGEGQLFYAYKRLDHEIIGSAPEYNVAPSNLVFVIPIPETEISKGNRNNP